MPVGVWQALQCVATNGAMSAYQVGDAALTAMAVSAAVDVSAGSGGAQASSIPQVMAHALRSTAPRSRRVGDVTVLRTASGGLGHPSAAVVSTRTPGVWPSSAVWARLGVLRSDGS